MPQLDPRRTHWQSNTLEDYIPDGQEFLVDNGKYNLVSSLTQDGMHMPAIDLDIPHQYVPSSTPGHGHLYLDVPMSWDKYELFLTLLNELGIIERGFLYFSIKRRASFLRAPGVRKPSKQVFGYPS